MTFTKRELELIRVALRRYNDDLTALEVDNLVEVRSLRDKVSDLIRRGQS